MPIKREKSIRPQKRTRSKNISARKKRNSAKTAPAASNLKRPPVFIPPAAPIVERTATPFISEPANGADRPKSTLPNRIPKIFFAIAIFAFPLVYLPLSLYTQDFTKQIFLSFIVGSVLLWALISRRGGITVSAPLIHPAVLIGVTALFLAFVSALRSGMVWQSLLGYDGTESLSVLALALLYAWTLIIAATGTRLFNAILYSAIASGSMLCVIALLFTAKIIPFNTAGTTTESLILAAVTTILALPLFLQSRSNSRRAFTAIALLPPLALMVSMGLRLPFLLLTAGLAVFLLISAFAQTKKLSRTAKGIFFVLAALALFAAIRPPGAVLNLPLEVSPSRSETLSIVRSTLDANPLLGSGPATFASDYLLYRSHPILKTAFWNLSFDWGSSAALTFLATMGWIGGGLLLLSIFIVAAHYGWKLRAYPSPANSGIFAAALVMIAAVWIAPAPLTVAFFFATVFGLMLARLKSLKTQNGISSGFNAPPLAVTCVSSVFIVIVILFLFLQGRRASAELYAANGIHALPENPGRALSLLERSKTLDPLNDRYLRMAGALYQAEIRKLLQTGFKPEDTDILQQIHSYSGRAISAAKRATTIAPSKSANWAALSNIYLEIAPITQGAAAAAKDALERALTLSPSDPLILVYLSRARGMAATENGDSTENEQLLLRAVKLRPSLTIAHRELARLYAGQGEIEKAVSAYRTAQTTSIGDPSLYYEIGLLFLSQNRTAEAQDALKSAIRLAPNFSNARWFLAQIYGDQNDTTQAIEQLQKIIELNPGNENAVARLRELQNKAE